MRKQKANSPYGYLQVLFYGVVNMLAATVKGCESARLYSGGLEMEFLFDSKENGS